MFFKKYTGPKSIEFVIGNYRIDRKTAITVGTEQIHLMCSFSNGNLVKGTKQTVLHCFLPGKGPWK